MLEHLWRRIFPSQDQETASKNIAKERLKLVLMHDRSANLKPETLQNLKDEIMEVVSKYIEIDAKESDVVLETDEESVALIANITVKSIKRL